MLTYRNSSGLHAFNVSDSFSYCEKVRAAHALADMLKRTRPHLYEKISEFQVTVTRCQQTLDESKARHLVEQGFRRYPREFRPSGKDQMAIQELDLALQELLNLRHKGQMAK